MNSQNTDHDTCLGFKIRLGEPKGQGQIIQFFGGNNVEVEFLVFTEKGDLRFGDGAPEAYGSGVVTEEPMTLENGFVMYNDAIAFRVGEEFAVFLVTANESDSGLQFEHLRQESYEDPARDAFWKWHSGFWEVKK